MPISIVVGGQFGSEGKGKVALEIVRRAKEPVSVVRVGGPNSGHTAYDRSGKRWALRQMPAACIDRNVDVVFPAGSYLDLEVLFEEIAALDYPEDRIFISPFANIITEEHRRWEASAGLIGAIGSTGSGVGAAVMAAVARGAETFPLKAIHVHEDGRFQKFEADTTELLTNGLDRGERVVIEGSQGFGLSLLEGGYWPKATSRVTTAAGALAEAGLSPLDVDDVTLVLRSFPIRVAGDSGPLPNEVTWSYVASLTGRQAEDIQEYTTVTKKLRRVGKFDPAIVRSAIAANRPNRIVLNHVDYVGEAAQFGLTDSNVRQFIEQLEQDICHSINWVAFDDLGVLNTEGILHHD